MTPEVLCATRSTLLRATMLLWLSTAALAARRISFDEVTDPRGILATEGDKTTGPSVGDLNQDGFTDIVICNHVRDPFEVYYGTSSRFNRTTFFTKMQDRHGTAIGDYDGDGDLDILLAIGGTRGERPASPVLGATKTDGTLERIESEEVGLDTRQMRGVGSRFVDLDNDGDLDLFILSRTPLVGGPSHSVFENKNGQYTLKPATGLEFGKNTGFVVFDYDGDGIMDILLIGKGIDFYKGDGRFTFTKTTREVMSSETVAKLTSQNFGGAGAFDFDNDGDLDLFLGGGLRLKELSGRTTGDDILLENQDGKFVDISDDVGLLKNGVTMGLTFADFNNDGWVDVFCPRSGPGERRIVDVLLINQGVLGQKKFTKSYSHGANGVRDDSFAVGAAALDIDQDGLMDVVVAARRHPSFGRTRLYKNTSGNPGKSLVLLLPTTNMRGDTTADGKVTVTGADGFFVSRRIGAQGEFRQQSFDQNVHIGVNLLSSVSMIDIELTSGATYRFQGPIQPGRRRLSLP